MRAPTPSRPKQHAATTVPVNLIAPSAKIISSANFLFMHTCTDKEGHTKVCIHTNTCIHTAVHAYIYANCCIHKHEIKPELEPDPYPEMHKHTCTQAVHQCINKQNEHHSNFSTNCMHAFWWHIQVTLTSVAPVRGVRATVVKPCACSAMPCPPWVHSAANGWTPTSILLCVTPLLETQRRSVLPRPCAVCAPCRFRG